MGSLWFYVQRYVNVQTAVAPPLPPSSVHTAFLDGQLPSMKRVVVHRFAVQDHTIAVQDRT